MSDIRFNQWLHQSGTGGVSQDHIGNIGIGTTNPSIVVSAANTAVLNVGVITANNLFVNNAFNGDITGNVTGNISGATGTFSGNVDIADKIIHTGDTDTAMRFPADNTFAVDTAGSERLRITSAGNVGIGSDDPQNKLDVAGDVKILDNSPRLFFYDANANGASSATGGFEVFDKDGNKNVFCGAFAPNADNLIFGVTGTERLRITSAGKIGIGVTAPTHMMEITNTGGTGTQIQMRDTSTGNGSNNGFRVGYNGSGGQLWNFESTYIRFATGNVERLRIDSSGRVLLGTTTPGHAIADNLTISDSGNCGITIISGTSNYGALYFGDSGGNNRGQVEYSHSADSLHFYTAAAERLRIDSSGRVMLGTQTVGPTAGEQLTIADSANAGITIRSGTTAAGTILFEDDTADRGEIQYSHNGDYMRFKTGGSERARIDSDGHLQIRREGVASMSGQDTRHTRYIIKQTNGQEAILGSVFAQGSSGWGGDLVFATKNDNGNPSSGLTERMRLDDTGKLTIKGETNAELNLKPGSGSGNDIISFENSGGTQRGNITYDTDNNFLFFNVSQSERTRIDQNGTLSHGTTTDNPGDANTNTGFAIRANGKYFFSCASDGGHINRNNAGYILHARYGGGHKGGVYVNSTNTSFQTSSDYRLKENIVNLDGAITRVKQLAPKRFNFIIEPGTTVDGFIAHEAAPVVPEAVTGTHNEVDDDGNPVYQGIDQAKLVPLLTAALQEAIAKIETLEAAVTALQGS